MNHRNRLSLNNTTDRCLMRLRNDESSKQAPPHQPSATCQDSYYGLRSLDKRAYLVRLNFTRDFISRAILLQFNSYVENPNSYQSTSCNQSNSSSITRAIVQLQVIFHQSNFISRAFFFVPLYFKIMQSKHSRWNIICKSLYIHFVDWTN